MIFDIVPLGVLLTVMGAGFGLLTVTLLRVLQKVQPAQLPETDLPPIPLEVNRHQDAVLMVEPGGRVLYANEQARTWFGLEEPNLERYARRTRPSEAFLGVCATEGQARFSISGRVVDAISYLVPHPSLGKVMVVSMRRPQVTVVGADSTVSGQTIEIFAELSQSMAASLDFETTLEAVLEGVEHLIPSDFTEITIWDNEKRHLVPYRFVGTASGERHMEVTDDRYGPEDGYSGYLITQREPLLVPDVDSFRDVRPVIDRRRYPFHSYLGVPLTVGGELIGTLELAAVAPNAFSETDMEVLRMLSGQAAVALHNAILFREEQRQSMELSGLAHLAQTTASIRDPEELFEKLIESIEPLFNVELLGVLTYDEMRHRLVGQSPFIGLPENFLALYQVDIPPASEAEEIFNSARIITALEPTANPDLIALGLHHVAQAAGMRQTLLAPLTSSGRMLGYLQIANRKDGASFEDDDIRLLSIVAAQVGPVLENVNLLRESRLRAHRAETMRRIAALAASDATLDEVLRFVLQEVGRELQADVVVIRLLDETGGILQVHTPSLFGLSVEELPHPHRIFVNSPRYQDTVTNTQQTLMLSHADEKAQIGEVYHALIEKAGMRSLLGVPLLVRQRGMGEIIVGARREMAFDAQASLFVSTVAGQLSGAVERAFLYGQTDITLRRRVEELTALTRVSRELNLTLDLEHILQRVLDEILRTVRALGGSIVLFLPDENGVVQYDGNYIFVGTDPSPWLHAVIQRARYLDEPLIIPDFKASDLPYPVEQTRSALLSPVIFQEQVSGFIYLWSQSTETFDQVAAETVQALSVQTAIALGNAQRYQEQTRRNELLNRRMATVTKLLEAAQAQSISRPLRESLEAIAYAIQDATPFNMVLISVYHPKGAYLERIAGAGFALGEIEELRNHTQPWKSIQEYLRDEYRRGSSYFIPAERKPLDPPDVHVFYPTSVVPVPEGEKDVWNPEDMLLTPLVDASGEPLGLISVDAPRNGLRPDMATIETLELFASQAALTVESHLRLRDLNQELRALQRRYERTRHLTKVGQRHLPFLLHKDVEQTLALYQLSNHTRRIRAGLDIAALVNQQADRESVYRVLARELLLRMEMDVVLVAENTPDGPILSHVVGAVPKDVNPDALFGQANPLRHALQSGESILVSDLNRKKDWRESALLRQLQAYAFIAIPIRVNQIRPEAAVLMVSQAPMPGFTPADNQLYALLGRQVALTLQNLHLLTETSHRLREVNLLLEFSRQLGGLEAESILRTLMDTAMQVALSAEAGQILWWDAQEQALVPRMLSGMVDEVKAMEIVYPIENTLPGQVFQQGRARRIPDVDFAQAYPLTPEGLLCYRDATGGRLPASSMIVPIQSGEHKWGVLVLDNYTSSDAFTIEGQTLVHSLTQQAALALENARLYQSAEQKAGQLQALTEAANALSANLEQAEGLIDSLLDHLAGIVAYDTATLWLRSGDTLTIRSARGFEDNDERVGISVLVEDSRLFQEMLRTSQPIVVGDVVQDERIPVWEEAPYLSWLGLPLVSKGALTGVIALEKTERDFYTPEDVQIAATFATQAAIVLENASLLQESLRRAEELDDRSQRLALLNELSADLSASLDVDEILRVTIDELFRALPCSSASVVLFSPEGQQPVLWVEAPDVVPELPQALPDAPLFERIRTAQGVFHAEDISEEEDLQPLLPYLKQHATRSLLAVPMLSGEMVHGVLLVHESRKPYRFTADEIELARTISNQAAIALQNARLYEETQSRLNEISAIYQISQALTSTIDLDELLARLPEQLSAIVDTRNMYLALYDAEHDLVSFPLAVEHGARIEVSPQPPRGLTGHILKTREPLLLVGDGAAEALASLNSVQIGAVEAAAYLGVPLLVGDTAIGVLAVEDPTNPHAYTENDLRLLTTAAAQLAVAIQNSRLFTEARQRTNDLSLLFEFGSRIAYELDESRLVNITFDVLKHALEVHTLALVVEDELGDLVGEVLDGEERLSGVSVPRDGSSLSEYVLQKGETLLIRDLQDPEERAPVAGYDVGQPVRSWLGVPLVARGKTIGVLSIQDYEPGRFTEQHALLLSQVAGQLATALDNARLFSQVQNYAEQLEHRVAERTQELAREHQRTETLLRIITELSASLDMDIVLNRTLALINQIVGAEQSTVMLVDSADDVLLRRASRGYTSPTPEGGHFTTIKSNEGLAGWVIKHQQGALVADVTKDERWVQNPEYPTQHRSAIAVPLMVGEEVLGTLMLFHREPNRFSEMHLDLVQATAKQIAVALNNAKLYRLVAEQAERLGDMLRTQHIETSRSQAILEAVADGVLVTDAKGLITLFNASAERILNLPRQQVLNQSLEHFSGLFGEAAHSWMETIRTWSANPQAYSNEDIYAERIELDNGRVVSVHLSPVLLRNEFLGTVSIFRDITHQVEVDRLKTEFVANVSHELRTPMTSIKGYVDIMLMGAAGKLSDQQANFLQVVRSNTERMITLVNDLLNISQMETGRIELDIQSVDLRPILENVVAQVRAQAEEEDREMTFDLDVPADLPLVRADAERAVQIIENLVDNAYHYTPAGGHVWVSAHREGDFVQVDVRDNGIGIPPEEQPRVFERFYRGEDVLVIETAGTGLGLSIVQNLVEMHGGKIWVESEGVPGAGSTFSFTLPIAPAQPEEAPVSSNEAGGND
ncbi:MAG: GAF domain-containing protein [Anaerolineae bacterium]|nr:MAG: GAF domain-containing protein [Anaerolineae bacterium]